MDILKDFGQWLLEDGKSPKTVESYCNDVKQFQKYVQAVNEDALLTRYLFVRYKQYLMDENFATSTINKKVNSLKVYNDYLQLKGIVNDNYIQLRKDRVPIALGSEQMVEAMMDAEVERVLAYIEDTEKVSMRNRLIVHLLLYTAVRVSELVSIKLTDIDFIDHTLIVRGKGGKVREIVIRQDLMVRIQHYIEEDRATSKFQDSPFLLLSQRSEKMHRDAVRDWLAKLSDDVGIKLHPHLFRRTCATLLLRRGVPVVTVSKILGHHSVDMTSKMYIQTSRQDKQEALDLL